MEIPNTFESTWVGCSQNPQCEEKPFCTSPSKFYIKDKSMKNNWVGNLPMKNIDVDELFNIRFIIHALECNLNYNDTIDT